MSCLLGYLPSLCTDTWHNSLIEFLGKLKLMGQRFLKGNGELQVAGCSAASQYSIDSILQSIKVDRSNWLNKMYNIKYEINTRMQLFNTADSTRNTGKKSEM